MAYSLSRQEIQKLRMESETEEMLRKQQLEEEMLRLAEQRETLALEIQQTKDIRLTDRNMDIQDDRDLRQFRRDRIKDLLLRQQSIEEEMMCIQRELDQMEMKMRYRKNMEMLEEDEDEESPDFESSAYEQIVIDEYLHRDSEYSEKEGYDETNTQPQQHMKGILKASSIGIERNVSFKYPTNTEAGDKVTVVRKTATQQAQIQEYQSAADTAPKQVHSDRTETEANNEYEYLTRQQSETRINSDPLQSTAREKEDSYTDQSGNNSIRLNITDVSQIEKNMGGSKIEQTSFMKRMDTEILDLDRRLAELSSISSNVLERTKERISSSPHHEELISKGYNRKQTVNAENLHNVRESEQLRSQRIKREIGPERIVQIMDDGVIHITMPSQEEKQKVSGNRTVIKDMFSDRTRDVVRPDQGYIKDSRPAIPASEQQPVSMDKRSQSMLPTQRRNRQFLEEDQQGKITLDGRQYHGSDLPFPEKRLIREEVDMNRMPVQPEQLTKKQEIKVIRQDREREGDYGLRRDEPQFNRQQEAIENENRWLIENRRKKENYITEKERQLEEKQRQLQERQQRLEAQEEVELRRQSLTPYDEVLQRKEEILEKKFKVLQMKEEQIKQREESMKGIAVSSEARIKKLEKEILALQLGSETSERSNQVKTELETKEANANTGSSVTAGNNSNQQSVLERITISTQDKPNYFPKFTNFSGEDPKPKKEASFEEWKYEVNCARRDPQYTESMIAQAIRKSLSGQAKRVLLPLGTASTVNEMLEKLEGVFGNVATGMSVLEEFYSASQKQGETVNAWSLRLEEILQRAIDKGHTRIEEKDHLLKEKFWRCLRSERLKNATQIYYHTMDSFELLRRKVRAEEYEMEVKRGIQHQPVNTLQHGQGFKAEETEDMGVIDRLAALEQDLKQLKKKKPFRRWQDQQDGQNQQQQQNQQSQQRQSHQQLNSGSTQQKGNEASPLN